jgi:hypothetical protein
LQQRRACNDFRLARTGGDPVGSRLRLRDPDPGARGHVTTTFFPGLTVTLPADWHVVEQGSEEFIIGASADGPVVKFWVDPTLVDRKQNPVGVANTPAAFVWLAKDPDLVVSGQNRR